MFHKGKINIMFIVFLYIDLYFGILIMFVGGNLYRTMEIYLCIMVVAGI